MLCRESSLIEGAFFAMQLSSRLQNEVDEVKGIEQANQ
jgi:hypothetical protein